MLKIIAFSLLLTLLLEELFAFILGMRGKRGPAIVALVNIQTNPAVVLLYYMAVNLLHLNAVAVTIVLECAAILAEWFWYRRCLGGLKHPFLFSVIVNLLSYGAGCMINLL